MTLDTRVYVTDHTDLQEMFTKCQSLLTQYDEDRRGPDRQRSRLTPDHVMNEAMQGLPAWLMIDTAGERPYRTAEQAARHEDCNHPDSPDAQYYSAGDAVCTETEHRPPCWYEVSFDTAYSYTGPDGMGCGDLHARLVAELGVWLDAKGVRWKWKNEFTGEVYEGYDALIGLASGGFEATAWFRTVVAPAIAHIAPEDQP